MAIHKSTYENIIDGIICLAKPQQFRTKQNVMLALVFVLSLPTILPLSTNLGTFEVCLFRLLRQIYFKF